VLPTHFSLLKHTALFFFLLVFSFKILNAQWKDRPVSTVAKLKAAIGKQQPKAELSKAQLAIKSGNYDKADSILQHWLMEADQLQTTSYQYYDIYASKGEALLLAGIYDQAYEGFLKSYSYAVKAGDKICIAEALKNLGVIYDQIGKKNIAQAFLNKAYHNALQAKAINLQADVMVEQANILLNNGELNQAALLYSKASDLFEAGYDTVSYARSLMLMADCYVESGINSIAADIYNHILFTFYWYEESRLAAQCLLSMGRIMKNSRQFDKATHLFHQALNSAVKTGEKKLQSQVYAELSKMYEALNDYSQALLCYKKYHQLWVEIYNDRILQQTNKLEAQYKAKQRQQEIIYLNKQNDILLNNATLKENQRNILIILAILLLVIVVLVSVNYTQKLRNEHLKLQQERSAYQQQIQDMLNAEELKTITAMLEGQDRERQRLARDLHDRVGSMLSATKLYFRSLLEVSDNETVKDKIKKASAILDDTTKEVRSISHDLEASHLRNEGLDKALGELSERINQSAVIRVHYHHYTEQTVLNTQLEIALYSIVQELISNVIKHANATDIHIEINRMSDSLNLIFTDNGVGFDVQKAAAGIGLKNIRKRLEPFSGSMEIDSTDGIGSTFIIDIPL
jgi:signal transduction histidine kinase